MLMSCERMYGKLVGLIFHKKITSLYLETHMRI